MQQACQSYHPAEIALKRTPKRGQVATTAGDVGWPLTSLERNRPVLFPEHVAGGHDQCARVVAAGRREATSDHWA